MNFKFVATQFGESIKYDTTKKIVLFCSPKFSGRKRGAKLIKHFSFKKGSN